MHVKTTMDHNVMVTKGDVKWHIASLMSTSSCCGFLFSGCRCCGHVAVAACASEPAKPFNTPLETAG